MFKKQFPSRDRQIPLLNIHCHWSPWAPLVWHQDAAPPVPTPCSLESLTSSSSSVKANTYHVSKKTQFCKWVYNKPARIMEHYILLGTEVQMILVQMTVPWRADGSSMVCHKRSLLPTVLLVSFGLSDSRNTFLPITVKIWINLRMRCWIYSVNIWKMA